MIVLFNESASSLNAHLQSFFSSEYTHQLCMWRSGIANLRKLLCGNCSLHALDGRENVQQIYIQNIHVYIQTKHMHTLWVHFFAIGGADLFSLLS